MGFQKSDAGLLAITLILGAGLLFGYGIVFRPKEARSGSAPKNPWLVWSSTALGQAHIGDLVAEKTGNWVYVWSNGRHRFDAATGKVLSSSLENAAWHFTSDGMNLLRVNQGPNKQRVLGVDGSPTVLRDPSLELMDPNSFRLKAHLFLPLDLSEFRNTNFQLDVVSTNKVILTNGPFKTKYRKYSKYLIDLRSRRILGTIPQAQLCYSPQSRSLEENSVVFSDDLKWQDGGLRAYDDAGKVQAKYYLPTLKEPGVWKPRLQSPRVGRLMAIYDNRNGHYDKGDGTVACWDLKAHKPMWSWRRPRHLAKVMAISPTSRYLAIGGVIMESPHYFLSKGFLYVFDVRSGASVVEFHERTSRDTEIAQDLIEQGKFEVMTPKGRITLPYPGDSGPTMALSWSPDGKYLYAGYGSGIIKKWRFPSSGKNRSNASPSADAVEGFDGGF